MFRKFSIGRPEEGFALHVGDFIDGNAGGFSKNADRSTLLHFCLPGKTANDSFTFNFHITYHFVFLN